MPAFLKNRKVQVVAGLVVLALVAWLIVSQLGSKPTPAPTPTVAPTTSAVVTPTVTPSQPTVAPTSVTPTPAPTTATPTVAPTTAAPSKTIAPVATGFYKPVPGTIPNGWRDANGASESNLAIWYNRGESCPKLFTACVVVGPDDTIQYPTENMTAHCDVVPLPIDSMKIKIGGFPVDVRWASMLTCSGKKYVVEQYQIRAAHTRIYWIATADEVYPYKVPSTFTVIAPDDVDWFLQDLKLVKA